MGPPLIHRRQADRQAMRWRRQETGLVDYNNAQLNQRMSRRGGNGIDAVFSLVLIKKNSFLRSFSSA
jgi:hypothetical protein